jgi:hypothetical protein
MQLTRRKEEHQEEMWKRRNEQQYSITIERCLRLQSNLQNNSAFFSSYSQLAAKRAETPSVSYKSLAAK